MNRGMLSGLTSIDDLERLDNRAMDRSMGAVDRLARTNAGDVTRLQGVHPPEWRLGVGGWRVRLRICVSRARPRDYRRAEHEAARRTFGARE